MYSTEICKQRYHFVGNDQFSRVFWGPDDQKCFQRVLLGFVVWGSEKLFLGFWKKTKIFNQLSFLELYADSEFNTSVASNINCEFHFKWGLGKAL